MVSSMWVPGLPGPEGPGSGADATLYEREACEPSSAVTRTT
jgi:hypothetical protein